MRARMAWIARPMKARADTGARLEASEQFCVESPGAKM